MENIVTLKTAKGILTRMRRIKECPVENRHRIFGRAWAYDLHNGQVEIRERFPELIPEMEAMLEDLSPKTIDDLTPIYP